MGRQGRDRARRLVGRRDLTALGGRRSATGNAHCGGASLSGRAARAPWMSVAQILVPALVAERGPLRCPRAGHRAGPGGERAAGPEGRRLSPRGADGGRGVAARSGGVWTPPGTQEAIAVRRAGRSRFVSGLRCGTSRPPAAMDSADPRLISPAGLLPLEAFRLGGSRSDLVPSHPVVPCATFQRPPPMSVRVSVADRARPAGVRSARSGPKSVSG